MADGTTSPLTGPPDYSGPILSDVVPAAALSLGAGEIFDDTARARAQSLGLDRESRTTIVVLIDGMGESQLRQYSGYTPFFRSMAASRRTLSTGFPSTTANSLSSLATGRLPGGHGVVGYRVLDPSKDTVFNQLTWDLDVDPVSWVPDATLFERLTEAEVDVVSLGEAKFAGRGLNRASLRGGRFRASKTLEERCAQAIEEAKAPGRRLVYLYWGNLDKTGHVHGSNSSQWTEELEHVDLALSQLANGLPADSTMVVTADHGMVDIDHTLRLDLADAPALRSGVRHVGGEPRAVHLYAEDGAEADVYSAWTETVGERALILSRDEAIRRGYFGPVDPRFRQRIGDFMIICRDEFAIVDSDNESASAIALIGHHGSTTERELQIPLLVV
ncbi:MAG: alkaline phosphatase family protein [Brevibacterium aurantiacum]|uniref:Alkaline phosphatase family protein n=2 Tax=Brevibacterium aurantiacum TaxID=273384 RepID=A0A1D7W2C7_BREAU|nr:MULTISPECIES: nucleotide pyrophosphatase/phosphodiesterase family protein [Brevibacterium]AOP53196.1 Alkaline phosphodiesterase I [Brevibacterium aurantiacum]AZL09018.1 alkaline phosphatase family protein [Brevibacterium aurantiacum]AZL12630.1 alkaline phosphatase family protein [Brevibacterium aurantiacum]AZT93104.1 alkaline phosphatase family protein [Brevibacterium aurantiacum]AZT96888.1 alkaline phosphatase family protein [Brevibacterium aurantiacum]